MFFWRRKKPKLSEQQVESIVDHLWSKEVEYHINNVKGIAEFITKVDGVEVERIAWPNIVYPKPWQWGWWRWRFVVVWRWIKSGGRNGWKSDCS